MTDTVVSVAAKVAEYLVAPVGRRCGYVIFTDSYVGQLREELEKLHEVTVGVQRSVNDAENNMMDIRLEVNRWKNDAENSADEARGVLNNDRRANKTCFCGWLPNPKERYCLGRDARKTAQAIQALIPQGNFERVYYERAPPGHVPSASDVNLSADDGGDTITDSRASIFQDIVKALDDEKHKVIGVYGPGGVGKTTLLEEVEKKLKNEGRPFHMIVKAKVSQTQNLNKIQDDIAYFFGLKLKDEPSEEGRRDLLCQRLQKDPSKKILIILDDLWDKLDLKAVGIPLGDKSRGCKLLLTSRFSDVLEEKMLSDLTFRLEGLNEGEAFKLFEKTVGDKLKDEELRRIAPEVIKKLAGLPLLIISVASTLKYSHVSAWKKALRKIDESHIETIVKLSYDHLDSEDAKSLFLLCGLIGGTIQVETLFVLGMGWGLFQEFSKTMQESREELNIALDSLRSICLLQDGGNDKENVTIHDLFSEVVVSIPFGGQNSLMMNSNYGSLSKEKLEKCWAICLVDADKKKLDQLMKCQFPNLKILMLSQPEGWRWRQEHECEDCLGLLDFEHMKELCVLYFRSMCIAGLPSSIKFLGNLHSLYLDHCNVEDVAILGELEALEILSFAWSTISRLPEEIGKLMNLRLLNMNHCRLLKIIMPGALKGLTNLEELHMKKDLLPWMDKHEERVAGLAELKNLTKLASLEISILDPIILLEDVDLPFENLDKFWINIGHAKGMEHFNQKKKKEMEYEGLTTMTLNLPGCDSILSKKGVEKNLEKTQRLYLSNLSEFEESPCKLCTQGFREVKYLDIKDSPSIKYIADSSNAYSSNGHPLIDFGKLESFFLQNLINLEKICHGPVTLECFNKLKAMRVKQCRKLKYLWCISDVQKLKHLEEIEVSNCDSMQSIVTHDAGEDMVSTNDRVELPKVRNLQLSELPNMTSFCHTSIQVSLPHLESLGMSGLLGPEEMLCSERSLKYSNLRERTIGGSKSTSKSILKLDWILKLPNLESMVITRCPTEVLFDQEELKVSGDVEILSRLTKLSLDHLPNLQSMWEQDAKLQGISILRNLRELYIWETGLSFLFSMPVAKCLREIKIITVEKCPNMKAMIVDEGRNEGTDDFIEFPLLEYLCITQCPMEKFFSYPCGKKEPVTTTSDSQDANSNSFFDRKVTFPNITSMQIYGPQCKELWSNPIPTDSFQKLESLILKNCDNLHHIATSYMWKKLERCLKKLEVISCRSIEIIYKGDGTDTESGKLRRLVLRDLENLRCIWQSDSLQNIPFPNLRDVEAVRCPRLEMLFPTFTVKFLEQIEELVVESCEDMKLIAGHEKWEEATSTTITFSKLAALKLSTLPKFRGFFPEKSSLKFPCFEDFPSLPDLEDFPPLPDFPSLRVLRIESCGAELDQVLGDWRRHLSEKSCHM